MPLSRLHPPLVVNQDGMLIYRTDLDVAQDRIKRLEADLEECRAFLEGQMDTIDGSYGEPSPNRAMQLVSMIDETLHGRPHR